MNPALDCYTHDTEPQYLNELYTYAPCYIANTSLHSASYYEQKVKYNCIGCHESSRTIILYISLLKPYF